MIGEDATSAFLNVLMKLLEIVKNISSGGGVKGGEKPVPKIKFGKVSQSDVKKMIAAGTEMKYITVPKDRLEDITKIAKDLGGTFCVTKQTMGKNAVIAVPASQMNAINQAIKMIAAEVVEHDPNGIKIMDGNNALDESVNRIAKRILDNSDIPYYSFKTKNGDYKNIVPTEYLSQYEAAVGKAQSTVNRLENIETTYFTQNEDLDKLEHHAKYVTKEEAERLTRSKLDVKFVKADEDKIAAVYRTEDEQAVNEALNSLNSEISESEKYLIDVIDNTVTINKETLLAGETADSYYTKLPYENEYIYIDKSVTSETDGGKTITAKLDMDKTYEVFDEDGNKIASRTGRELSKAYNVPFKHTDKDTQIAKYGTGIERIDLYSKEQNKLISVSIDSAEKIKAHLVAEGISNEAAERLLHDIEMKLPESYKQIFSYSYERPEIVYADVPNIGDLVTKTQLSAIVINHDVKNISEGMGGKVLVHDRTNDSYGIISAGAKADITAGIKALGYDGLTAQEIAERKECYFDGAVPVENMLAKEQQDSKVKISKFQTDNPEFMDIGYIMNDSGIILIKNDDENISFMEIENGTPPADIIKSVSENGFIKDEISTAVFMSEMRDMGVTELNSDSISGISFSRLSEKYMEIDLDGERSIMDITKPDRSRLLEMGISEKTVRNIEKSFAIAAQTKNINPEKGKKLSLGQLKTIAKEQFAKIQRDKSGGTQEKSTEQKAR